MLYMKPCSHCLGPLEWWSTQKLAHSNATWICNICHCIYDIKANAVAERVECLAERGGQ